MCRLTLAWVTSENSTKQLECRHLLTRSYSLDPIFSAGLTAPVSGVDCPCPWFHANYLSAPFSNQLSFASPYHFRIRRDFRSKNPVSGFAPKQTKESSAWRATCIVLHFPLLVCVDQYIKCVDLYILIFTNPSARAGYDTRSIFKRSLTGLNSEFSFS